MCQFVLHLLRVPDERIHREIFFFDSAPSSPLNYDSIPKKISLKWNDERFTFMVQHPQSILDAALKQGIALPYSCRGGRCSTCAIKCISGQMSMSINEVLTHKDLQQGWVLTCVGYPASDLVLEYP
ncbi:MAG: 2Fe-2S iron-sulfur cluster binding domain-containing protein [Chitinophagaceae bacterium]